MYACQQSSGAYYPQRQPLTDDELQEHLDGIASYGAYVIRPTSDAAWGPDVVSDNTVKYIVFDLDTHDPEATAHLLHEVERFTAHLPMMNPEQRKKALLLEASGNKGVHVWCFFDKPLPARQVRVWVARDFMPEWEKLGITLEVFPKQDTVDEGGYGNLVKLPLGKHAVSQQWSHFIPRQGWASQIEEVVPLAASLVPQAPVVTPGIRPAGRTEGGSSGVGGHSPHDGPTSPFPCVDFIQREGAQQGYRDQAMFHLALYYFGHGLDQDLAEEMCLRANENFDPPMGEADIRDKVRSAYRGRYQSARCGTDWLRDLCPGPCKGGWKVLATQEGDLRSAQIGDAVEVEVVRRVSERGAVRVTLGHPDSANNPTMILK